MQSATIWEDGLSVDLERLTSPQKAIQDVTRYRLYILPASIPLSLGLTCLHDPVEGNPAHALITGDMSKPIARKLARAAQRMIYP